MILNRSFKKFLLCLILLCSSSCVTKYLWGDKVYRERINQFLIGEDGRYVVMIGEHHYVFTDNSRVFSKILSLKQVDVLTINVKKSYIKLSSNNDVKGYVTFEGTFRLLPIEDIGVLSSMGYRPDRNDQISIKIDIQGRRYSSKYLGPSAAQSSIALDLPISYNDSSAAKDIGKAAITPITIGIDAVLLIGKIVVAPLSL